MHACFSNRNVKIIKRQKDEEHKNIQPTKDDELEDENIQESRRFSTY